MNRSRATKLAANRSQLRQEVIKRRDYQRLLGITLVAMFPILRLRGQAIKILEYYDSNKPEAYRVRLAVLKLSGTDLTKIQQGIESAIEDHEDVIAWAEFPRQTMCAIGNKKLTLTQQEQLLSEDAKEFEEWLRTSKGELRR